MDTKEEVELLKTASIWSLHVLKDIQARIERDQPELRNETEETDLTE